MPALGRSRSSSWAMQAPGSPQQQGIDFSHEGLGSLKALFNRCREQSASGAVDLAALQAAFAQSKSAVPPTLVEAIFERLDDNGDGVVDVRDFVGGLCCCFGGSVEDKLEFCFSLFAHGNSSSGGKSVLDRKGMGLLIKSLWSVEDIHLACARDAMTVEGSVISGDGDWLDLRLPPPALVLERETSSSPEVLAGIDALVGRAMADFGGGGDDALLTLRQFTAWAQRAGSSGKGVELSSSLTERLERATFVDIGIVPPDPATELRLVHGMAKAARIPVFDPAAPGPVGTVWCVVEKGWLDSWCDSVGISSFQQILQPAESLVAAPSIPPPQKRLRKYLPPLDNRALVDSWGQLLPTVFHREQYELIGAEVARILTAWYGDSTGGPIERLVIDAAQDGDVERENETADAVPSSVLEVFPPLVTVTLESEETVGFPTIRCWIASAADPLSTAVLQEAKERFALSDSDEARLWYNNPTNGVWGLVDDQREPKKMEDDGNDDFGDDNAGDRLYSPPPLPRPLTLGVLCAGEQQPQFLLEVRSGPLGSWPRGGPQEAGSPRQQGVVSPMVTSPVSASPVKRARVEAAHVLCGLSNLGNTVSFRCF
jgi:Ca2+-binding EF-hand superfamily protein